jgi:hypothetical protein
MQSLVKKAKNHLRHNSMSYSEHFAFAFGYGLVCTKAGMLLCVHSILPCFFERAGSRLVHKLERIFVERESEINEPKLGSETSKD